ncbi:hypothetical protein AB4Z22_36070, partial [Paenibacillus sp. TAF58]
VTDMDLEGLKTTEFSTVIERLYKLIESGELDSRYSFFTKPENKETLTELNKLRNRITHRGTFVLRYEALDIFVGQFVTPLVLDIINLEEYKKIEGIWKYRKLQCEIDPIQEIYQEFKINHSKPNLAKVAILKELGRAAFNNPIRNISRPNRSNLLEYLDQKARLPAERVAEYVLELPIEQAESISICPVCNTNALVTFEESDGELNEEGNYDSYWTYSTSVKCFCCTFELESNIGNPQSHGLNISEFFRSIIHY